MNNKFYTPDIKDIRIGYQYEQALIDCNWAIDAWEKRVVTVETDLTLFKDYPSFQRTPYLTKEDIISLGFDQLDSIDPLFGKNSYLYTIPKNPAIIFEMDGFSVRLYLKHEQGKIRIEKQMFGGFSGNEELYEQVYYGSCNSKNELKTILSWIK